MHQTVAAAVTITEAQETKARRRRRCSGSLRCRDLTPLRQPHEGKQLLENKKQGSEDVQQPVEAGKQLCLFPAQSEAVEASVCAMLGTQLIPGLVPNGVEVSQKLRALDCFAILYQ